MSLPPPDRVFTIFLFKRKRFPISYFGFFLQRFSLIWNSCFVLSAKWCVQRLKKYNTLTNFFSIKLWDSVYVCVCIKTMLLSYTLIWPFPAVLNRSELALFVIFGETEQIQRISSIRFYSSHSVCIINMSHCKHKQFLSIQSTQFYMPHHTKRHTHQNTHKAASIPD